MKKRIFSGIQPSGNLHLGNYLGAIKNWIEFQDKYECIFCVVDMHAITVPQNPEQLRKNTLKVAKIYLAAGIDPKKSQIFVQSHIPQHAELMWILNTIAKNGDLMKMTQFKEKSKVVVLKKKLKGEVIDKKALTRKESLEFLFENLQNAGTGLFNYPILMAADILLYNTELVPVGKDQLQHIELTRTLARRFNDRFGETFIIPKSYTEEEGMNIMGLDNPNKKMSKSAKSEYNYISLLDNKDMIEKKIKKAVTDSGSEIVYRDDKPALKNLINIYSLLSGKDIKKVENDFKGKGYKEFKENLAEVIIGFLHPFQTKFNDISDNQVLDILQSSAKKLQLIAKKKMYEVKTKIGFIA